MPPRAADAWAASDGPELAGTHAAIRGHDGWITVSRLWPRSKPRVDRRRNREHVAWMTQLVSRPIIIHTVAELVPLEQRAKRICSWVGLARSCIILSGRELIANEELRHGERLPWLKTEFGWSDRTAQNTSL